MSDTLVIGGFGMSLGDASPYWDIVPGAETRECIQNAGSTNEVNTNDVLRADRIVCYSYGAASLKKLWHDLAPYWPKDKTYEQIVVIAGVPDFWMQQFYLDLWHMPVWVQKAVCFQVDGVPVSCDLSGVATVPFADNISLYSFDRLNVDCNALVCQYDIVGRHTHIQNHPKIIAKVRELFE